MIRAALILALLIAELVFGVLNRSEAGTLVLQAPSKTCRSKPPAFVLVLHISDTQEETSFLLDSENFVVAEGVVGENFDDCIRSASERGQVRCIDFVKISPEIYFSQSRNQKGLRSDFPHGCVSVPLVDYRDSNFESFPGHQTVIVSKGNTPYNESRPVGGEELQTPNGVLLFLNVGLTPQDQHLFFGSVGPLAHFSRLKLCGYGHDPRCLVGTDQKEDLESRDESQTQGESSHPPSIVGDSFIGRFWLSNAGGATFGGAIGVILCLLIWRYCRRLPDSTSESDNKAHK